MKTTSRPIEFDRLFAHAGKGKSCKYAIGYRNGAYAATDGVRAYYTTAAGIQNPHAYQDVDPTETFKTGIATQAESMKWIGSVHALVERIIPATKSIDSVIEFQVPDSVLKLGSGITVPVTFAMVGNSVVPLLGYRPNSVSEVDPLITVNLALFKPYARETVFLHINKNNYCPTVVTTSYIEKAKSFYEYQSFSLIMPLTARSNSFAVTPISMGRHYEKEVRADQIF